MKTRLIDAFARAFGMLVFVVVSLWFAHQAFPRNWSAVAVLYLLCVPFAAVYDWLVGSQPDEGEPSRRQRVPGLLLIGLAVAVAVVGYAAFRAEIDGIFYGGGTHMTSNNTLNTDRQQASACWSAPRVRGAGGLA